MTIKGTGNYKGTVKETFTIKKKAQSLTVKKGTPKGTYKIKIKVTSAATTNYKKASETVTVTVKVKQ